MFSRFSVLVTSRIGEINQIYNSNDQNLDFSIFESSFEFEPNSCQESIFIVPKNFRSPSSKVESALVSGWAIWSKYRQNAFALSDHADFKQLIDFVETCNPRVVLTCFGNKSNSVLAKYLEKSLKIEARPLKQIPTKFLAPSKSSVIKSCMHQILKVFGMPGFLYSKKWISMEIKSFGFTNNEITEALDHLIREGLVRLSDDRSHFLIEKVALDINH